MTVSFKFYQSLTITVFVFIVLMVSPACNHRSGLSINDLAWLEGNWTEADGGNFCESWTLDNDNVLRGFGFSVEGSDTLMSEQLKIYTRGSQLYYQALVAGQNGEKPVDFRLSSPNADSLVFENPGHDFPKFIVYKKLSDREMAILVTEGFQSGDRSFTLKMFKDPL